VIRSFSIGRSLAYLLPLIHPDASIRELQVLLGVGLVLANGLLYALWLARRRRRR
jgi:hypothetical protein